MQSTILVVYAWGDWSNKYVIGIATDKEKAIKIITAAANKFTTHKSVVEVSDNKFRIVNSVSDPSEYDYWIEEEKINTLF